MRKLYLALIFFVIAFIACIFWAYSDYSTSRYYSAPALLFFLISTVLCIYSIRPKKSIWLQVILLFFNFLGILFSSVVTFLSPGSGSFGA